MKEREGEREKERSYLSFNVFFCELYGTSYKS